MKPSIKRIRKDIGRIPTSSRAQHVKIKKTLEMLLDLFEERVGPDPTLTDLAKELEEPSCGQEKILVKPKTVKPED